MHLSERFTSIYSLCAREQRHPQKKFKILKGTGERTEEERAEGGKAGDEAVTRRLSRVPRKVRARPSAHSKRSGLGGTAVGEARRSGHVRGGGGTLCGYRLRLPACASAISQRLLRWPLQRRHLPLFGKSGSSLKDCTQGGPMTQQVRALAQRNESARPHEDPTSTLA